MITIKDRLKAFLNKPVETTSVKETYELAASLADCLQPGDIVCLHGDLGAGKTHFVKGIAASFGINPDTVSSPTFTLIHEYRGGPVPVFHFDFYRLKSEEEALDIGAEEYFYSDGICFVEWPEKALGIIPNDAIWIEIKHLGDNRRRIFFRLIEK